MSEFITKTLDDGYRKGVGDFAGRLKTSDSINDNKEYGLFKEINEGSNFMNEAICSIHESNDLTKCFFPCSLIKGTTPLEKSYVYSPNKALNSLANLEVPHPLSFAA